MTRGTLAGLLMEWGDVLLLAIMSPPLPRTWCSSTRALIMDHAASSTVCSVPRMAGRLRIRQDL